MSAAPPALAGLLDRYSECPEAAALRERLDALPVQAGDELIVLYEQAIPIIEARLWADRAQPEALAAYQALFREVEDHIGALSQDDRHAFLVVVPVADRPLHLESCLASLLRLCETFRYGGCRDGRYPKVAALVADDSQDPANIARNRALAADFTRRGLVTEYFGLDAQQQQLDSLNAKARARLGSVLGDPARGALAHKGASLMRNLTYLRLAQIAREDPTRLYHFVDSDQAFEVSLSDGRGDRALVAVNFFYHLDRIFTRSDILVLTGKVVGDPPVSPAVMAGNLLEDVLGFLARIAQSAPEAPCSFHGGTRTPEDDAAYHDMAELFGFTPASRAFDYRCGLSGPHDHRACLAAFAGRLDGFFDGEHPTRKTAYEHQDVDTSVKPARTVYTGNYLLRAEALAWHIPFATLGLRMAGPVLGRILKAETGARFVSANLPMRHGRTVSATGQSEFRPGVSRDQQAVDLSGELERQFFGDVMLFTVERLTAEGYPRHQIPDARVKKTLAAVEREMLRLYTEKRQRTLRAVASLRAIAQDRAHWWTTEPGLEGARQDIARLIENLDRNFGEDAPGYAQIQSADHRSGRRIRILDAILGYGDARSAWASVLAR